jgi:hypothetical protein
MLFCLLTVIDLLGLLDMLFCLLTVIDLLGLLE